MNATTSEPHLRGNNSMEQTLHFAEAMIRGDKNRGDMLTAPRRLGDEDGCQHSGGLVRSRLAFGAVILYVRRSRARPPNCKSTGVSGVIEHGGTSCL